MDLMPIPHSHILTTEKLGRVFTQTVATYKFFWFLSIMQIFVKDGRLRIDVWDIVIRMVANAWYPIHYFRLSFGKSDSLFDIVTKLQLLTQIPIDASVDEVVDALRERKNEKVIKQQLRILTLNVPYRFLSPWIATSDNNEMVKRSQKLENGCLYSLHKNGDEFYIELNKAWSNYLQKHYNILVDFTYWNLVTFLQARNPNVPAISNKLIRPESRNPLTNQHKYWDKVIDLGGPIRCIYTGNELHSKSYDLDHFIPWSFVSHDLLWNLIPSDGSINSSKNDKLPNLDIYLPRMADIQQHSLQVLVKRNVNMKIMEDYTSLGYTPEQLAKMSKGEFRTIYEKIFKPLSQIAINMGFDVWENR